MSKPFNFYQYIESGGSGVEPFSAVSRHTGFAEFYTPENILTSQTSGNFPLVSDYLHYPTRFIAEIFGQFPDVNVDRTKFDLSFYGRFFPLNTETQVVGGRFTGEKNRDNIDRPVFITSFSGDIKDANVERQTLGTSYTGNKLGCLIDNPTLKTSLAALLSGDAVEVENLSLVFSGNFYKKRRDELGTNVQVVAFTFSKGNLKTEETIGDSASTNFAPSRFIWGIGA